MTIQIHWNGQRREKKNWFQIEYGKAMDARKNGTLLLKEGTTYGMDLAAYKTNSN